MDYGLLTASILHPHHMSERSSVAVTIALLEDLGVVTPDATDDLLTN